MEKPLLTIEVQDIESVPIVKYKGEVVNKEEDGMFSVSYEWLTVGEGLRSEGKHSLSFSYWEGKDNKFGPTLKTVKEQRNGE